MTAEEFLKEDNSYLVVPHKTDNILSRTFWSLCDDEKHPHTLAGCKGNQREAYESGVKIGWNVGQQELSRQGTVPHPVGLTKEEQNEFCALLYLFGYQTMYWQGSPFGGGRSYGFNPGINVCKNTEAYEQGVVISDENRKKAIEYLKELSPNKNIWK